MRAKTIVSAAILAVSSGGAAVGSLGCGNSTEPEGLCETVHLSSSGRELWGDCCGATIRLIGPSGLSATAGCSADSPDSEGSWEITVKRGADGVITS
jgi:hypothetical protein